MKFVFLMDPIETVVMKKDTSFILMLGAYRNGHETYFLPSGGMTCTNGKVLFHLTKVKPHEDEEQPFFIEDEVVLTEDDIDAVFIRTDPPFNEEYLLNTWLLDLITEKVFVMNQPSSIRSVNEKIWATQFVDFIPSTIVSRNKNDLIEFIKKESKVVAKPTDGFGGQSVFIVNSDDTNMNVILETLTQNWQKEIIIQKFVEQSVKGDKRIILLNGEPLGAVLRVHGGEDHRNNFFSGGKPEATTITERELEVINVLKLKLKELGLYFVGIDFLGDYLIEVNVTSPTCLQEMNRLYDQRLEDKVIDFIEQKVSQLKGK